MQTTWAESQWIYARRLGVLLTLRPGTLRVYDALLRLDQSTTQTTIGSIAAAAHVSRSVAKRAISELSDLRMVFRCMIAGDNAGSTYQLQDLAQRAHVLEGLRRPTPVQNRTEAQALVG